MDQIALPQLLALVKPRHRHIPLPSQAESDTLTVVYPTLRPSRGEITMELDIVQSLTRVRILGYDSCVAAIDRPLPSRAVAHQIASMGE